MKNNIIWERNNSKKTDSDRICPKAFSQSFVHAYRTGKNNGEAFQTGKIKN